MAVNISNTKHFKKGEKLPDGTTAKRGVVWNTKTNRRVTGKVLMTAAGQGAMGATKSYKAGRAVKPKVSSGRGGSTSSVRRGDGGDGGGGKEGPKPPNVGDLRKGPRGALNRWNGSRWVRASKGSTYQAGQGMTARPKTDSAPTSGAKSSGATGTYTRSYGRSSRGQMTVAAYLSSQTQRAREKRRASRMTKKK